MRWLLCSNIHPLLINKLFLFHNLKSLPRFFREAVFHCDACTMFTNTDVADLLRAILELVTAKHLCKYFQCNSWCLWPYAWPVLLAHQKSSVVFLLLGPNHKNHFFSCKGATKKLMEYGQADEQKPVSSCWPISPHPLAS